MTQNRPLWYPNHPVHVECSFFYSFCQTLHNTHTHFLLVKFHKQKRYGKHGYKVKVHMPEIVNSHPKVCNRDYRVLTMIFGSKTAADVCTIAACLIIASDPLSAQQSQRSPWNLQSEFFAKIPPSPLDESLSHFLPLWHIFMCPKISFPKGTTATEYTFGVKTAAVTNSFVKRQSWPTQSRIAPVWTKFTCEPGLASCMLPLMQPHFGPVLLLLRKSQPGKRQGNGNRLSTCSSWILRCLFNFSVNCWPLAEKLQPGNEHDNAFRLLCGLCTVHQCLWTSLLFSAVYTQKELHLNAPSFVSPWTLVCGVFVLLNRFFLPINDCWTA